MSNRKEKTVTLNYQGRVDGTVEAFDINGMMTVPGEDGVTYIRWEDVVAFFPQASAGLPVGAEVAAGVLQGFIEHNGPDFAAKIQPVIDHLMGRSSTQKTD